MEGGRRGGGAGGGARRGVAGSYLGLFLSLFFLSPCRKKGSRRGGEGGGLWDMSGRGTYHSDMKALLAFSHLFHALRQ